jgi:uncharacterized SAM-binding protein YcdF (DUF218 family)
MAGRCSEADAIVVLGCRGSAALTRRLDRGIRLFREGVAPLLLLSGGGSGSLPEAEHMRPIAMIPRSHRRSNGTARTVFANSANGYWHASRMPRACRHMNSASRAYSATKPAIGSRNAEGCGTRLTSSSGSDGRSSIGRAKWSGCPNRAALARGVPEAAMLVDAVSRNTVENARQTARLLSA